MHHGVACVEIASGPWARPNLAPPLGKRRFFGFRKWKVEISPKHHEISSWRSRLRCREGARCRVWAQSMEWFHVLGSEGGSRVGSHVNSHSIDILVVPWVPKDLVCLAYDFMRAVGHMQGLQEPFSCFFVFFRICSVRPRKRQNPPAGVATRRSVQSWTHACIQHRFPMGHPYHLSPKIESVL